MLLPTLLPFSLIFFAHNIEIPGDWKLARVAPVYRNKGGRNDASNYRPISVLTHVAKLIETCIKRNTKTHQHTHTHTKLQNRNYNKKYIILTFCS